MTDKPDVVIMPKHDESNTLFGVSKSSYEDFKKQEPIDWESMKKDLMEEMSKLPPPPGPVIVSYKMFQDWVKAGIIDENGKILPMKIKT